MKVKALFSVMLLMTAVSASAQYVHIVMNDGTKYDIETSTIKTMKIDSEAPKPSGVDGQIAGHDYVEIGGKKWATMNIGATTVAGSDAVATPSYIKLFNEDYGITKVYSCFGTYFKWGETTPTKGTFLYPPLNTCDNPTLCSKHDAAAVIWGSTWRTPTPADFMALSNACAGNANPLTPKTPSAKIEEGGIYWLSAAQEYESDYTGVAGILFVDKAYPNKRVFFPAAGYIVDTTLDTAGETGWYWASSLFTESTDLENACRLIFDLYSVSADEGGIRVMGSPVRPVSD